MKDFIMTALPWVCLGVALAVCAVNFNKRQTDKQEHDNCMTEGICFGICFGLLLGSEYLSYGLLIGMVIGMCIHKTGKDEGDKKNE